MANFKACVRRPRSDGFWQVYIRVTHHRGLGYIKTDKMVTKKELTKTSEIKDAFVLSYCADLIIRYNNLLNTVNAEEWTVNQVIEFLTTESQDICFSDYARIHINRMINSGHERTSKNYKYAVENLERYIGSNKLMFGQLTSAVLKKWIESLRNTNRAKEMYPINIRQIFKAAIVELNDEEKGIVKIKFNPWNKIKIPKADKTTQRGQGFRLLWIFRRGDILYGCTLHRRADNRNRQTYDVRCRCQPPYRAERGGKGGTKGSRPQTLPRRGTPKVAEPQLLIDKVASLCEET